LDDPRLIANRLKHVLLIKRMIAKRDAIGARLEQPSGMGAGQPHHARGVLAVDHNEIQPPLRAQARQGLGHRRASRTAHHIA
jgi:hypothetical protein